MGSMLLRNNTMKKLNKFEKKFVIVDLFSTGTIFGGAFMLLIHRLTPANLIIAILIMSYYYFILRKGMWRTLEMKEREEIFNLPNDWKENINIFDYFKTQKDPKHEYLAKYKIGVEEIQPENKL